MENDSQKEKWQTQIEVLVELAFKEGLSKAIEEAKKLDDPFLLDKFHDTLANELYQELIEKEHKK